MTQGIDDEAATDALAGLLAPLLGLPPASSALAEDTWRALAARAARERLAPLLYCAVQRTGRADIPPDVLATLAQAHCRSAAAVLYQQQELAQLLRRCAAAQISCIVLKGSALAATLYPDPALRPCGDIDLLFAPEAIPDVVAMLGERGYVNQYGRIEAGRLPRDTSEYHFSRFGSRPAIVEPHWHITSNPYYIKRMPISWFWEQTAPVAMGGMTAQVLTSPAQFLHLVSHYFLHYQGHHLLWSFDLALLLVRQGNAWNWEMLARRAERFGLGIFVQRALALVAHQWGVTPPHVSTAALAGIRADYGERVAAWVAQQPEAPAWMLWQAAQTPSPLQRVHLLANLVLPSPSGLRCLLHRREGSQVVRGYLRRIWRLPGALWALGRSLWQLR